MNYWQHRVEKTVKIPLTKLFRQRFRKHSAAAVLKNRAIVRNMPVFGQSYYSALYCRKNLLARQFGLNKDSVIYIFYKKRWLSNLLSRIAGIYNYSFYFAIF